MLYFIKKHKVLTGYIILLVFLFVLIYSQGLFISKSTILYTSFLNVDEFVLTELITAAYIIIVHFIDGEVYDEVWLSALFVNFFITGFFWCVSYYAMIQYI